ncbi:MAG: polysaccharide deacetylase family protein [Bacteroidia bacterium]
MPQRIKVFLFHRISESRENWAHGLHVSVFEKCVKYITRNFEVKTVEECLAMQGKEVSKGSKQLACITFDDGFKDNIKYAVPILDKYKCPASFYIVTGCIDMDLPTWPHLYYNFFKNTRKLSLIIDSKYLGGGIDKKFSSGEEREDYGKQLLSKLKLIPAGELQMVLDSIMQSFNDVPKPEKLMMTWDDVKQLSSTGFTIGSHTHSHHLLPLMENDEQIKYELLHSAERIKEKCGRVPETIAYPLGIADQRVINLAKASGYKYGLIVEQRFYEPSNDDIMAVPRVDIYAQSNWLKTYLRLTGKMEVIKKVFGDK